MNAILRYFFFLLVIKPLALFVLGLNIRNYNRFPNTGPAIIVANHNSHLDTIVLMSLFPIRTIKKVRPVAAAEYFLRNKFLRWFSLKIIGVIPLSRTITKERKDHFRECCDALNDGNILIFYPEGSRGEPEHLANFKNGIAHLVGRNPAVPVIPVFIHGCGKSLPKGARIFVPFFCDIFIGEKIFWRGCRTDYLSTLNESMESLASEGHFPEWE